MYISQKLWIKLVSVKKKKDTNAIWLLHTYLFSTVLINQQPIIQDVWIKDNKFVTALEGDKSTHVSNKVIK